MSRAQRVVAAAEAPVARLALEVSLPHLDRSFDYLVPESLSESAQPGVRVRVGFAGRAVGGFVLERLEESEHAGQLAYLSRVISPEAVLAPEIAALCRVVADRYAGTLADVLRLAVPPRHAAVESEARKSRLASAGVHDPACWSAYPGGAAYLRNLAGGGAPRAVWSALPGARWPEELAQAVVATKAGGRGSVIVVPDSRDLARLDAALHVALGEGQHVSLAAELGPAERYRRWLAVRRGEVRVVVGTRSAAFAPVVGLGLVACWDDGDDLHAEPRAPYPHTREVLLLRSHLAGTGFLLGGFARTAEGAQLLRSGWARELVAPRARVRAAAPHVLAAGAEGELARDEAARAARLPTLAWSVARKALTSGPVLVQVPRRGYVPALNCGRCRRPARCPACAGPLALAGGSGDPVPACRWCGKPAAALRCLHCGSGDLRAAVVGLRRTAEELGRSLPGVPLRTSGRDAVIASVPSTPALIVATPGAEPLAEDGYAAALLLDGWALLGRADLRAGEEALRRWLTAAALVRSRAEGGSVVIMAAAGLRPVEALIRWAPEWFSRAELEERTELGFPPARRVASITGAPQAVRELVAAVALSQEAGVLGPIPAGEGAERVLILVPRDQGRDLADALKAGLASRSARKAGQQLRVQLDPAQLG